MTPSLRADAPTFVPQQRPVRAAPPSATTEHVVTSDPPPRRQRRPPRHQNRRKKPPPGERQPPNTFNARSNKNNTSRTSSHRKHISQRGGGRGRRHRLSSHRQQREVDRNEQMNDESSRFSFATVPDCYYNYQVRQQEDQPHQQQDMQRQKPHNIDESSTEQLEERQRYATYTHNATSRPKDNTNINITTGVWADTTSLRKALVNGKTTNSQLPPHLSRDEPKSILETHGNLTLLTSSRNVRQQRIADSPHPETSLAENDKEDNPTSSHPVVRTNKWNMEKMRNRWWELLRHRNFTTEPAQPARDSAQTDTVSSDSSESVFSLAPVPLPRSLETSVPVLDEIYTQSELPLHEAIKRGDEQAVRVLLRKGVVSTTSTIREGESTSKSDYMDPVQLAVHLDNASILRILVSAGPVARMSHDDRTSDRWPPAPCLAALRGQAECLAVFLDTSSAYLLQKDAQGNDVLHLLCRGTKKSARGLLSSCLQHLKTQTSSSFVTKLLLQKNDSGETCLHVAAANGRPDFVELFLNFASISLLSKLLSIQDKTGQTPLLAAVASASIDTVMSLLMWSGNNSLVVQKGGEPPAPSPLTWAASLCHADMVEVLLDFYNGSENKTDFDDTLRVVVRLPAEGRSIEAKHKIIRQLVLAGANPCSEESGTNTCAMEIATTAHDSESMRVTLDSYEDYLTALNSSRRRDPVLKQQPESFFQGKESGERVRLRVALRNALVVSIVKSLKCDDEKTRRLFEDCTLLLYEKGATLDCVGFDNLRNALGMGVRSCESASLPEVFYSRRHDQPPCSLLSTQSPRKRLLRLYGDKIEGKSGFLWPSVAMNFSWVSQTEQKHFERILDDGNHPKIFDVLIQTVDGETFEANGELLSSKSAKLAAALRFARLQGTSSSTFETLSIAASAEVCRLLLQHMYYGSIVDGLPEDGEQCCRVLLDLSFLAEDLICESLLQECEIRLLSKNPWECHCSTCQLPAVGDGSLFARVCSGPSKCVTLGTALDVLATADNLEAFLPDVSYRIQVPSRSNYLRSGTIFEWLPFQKVRHVVAVTCLSNNFVKVFDSAAFQSHVAISPGDTKDFQHLFLRYCLDEYVSGEKVETVKCKKISSGLKAVTVINDAPK